MKIYENTEFPIIFTAVNTTVNDDSNNKYPVVHAKLTVKEFNHKKRIIIQFDIIKFDIQKNENKKIQKMILKLVEKITKTFENDMFLFELEKDKYYYFINSTPCLVPLDK